MSTFHVYRIFRYCAKEVWSCELPDGLAALMKHSQRTPLKYMLSDVPPYVFPKAAIPLLVPQFETWWMTVVPPTYNPIKHSMLSIIQAYPSSYHHAAAQEMGIGFGIDGGLMDINVFGRWPCYRWMEMQENGDYERKGLARNELAKQKKNNKPRPAGVPDDVWRGL